MDQQDLVTPDLGRSGPGDDLLPGTTAGEYVIEHRLAAGGCGAVYVAHHRVLGHAAALKVVHRDAAASPKMLERFLREARTLARLDHPNIIHVFDAGRLPDDRPWYAMELLVGVDLDRLLIERGRLGPAEVLAFLGPVCAALDAAHAAGVVHRDLKGSNIFVGIEQPTPRITLLDFGIIKLIGAEDNSAAIDLSASVRVGTPSAMSPEQILGGAIDTRADVYALGVLLFRMLTGRHPFVARDQLELQALHLFATPPRPSELAPVPPAIDAVVQRAMAKDPTGRYPTAGALFEAVRALLQPAPAPPIETALVPMAAIFLEVQLASDEPAGDELLDTIGALLDDAEARVEAAGFSLPARLQISTGLLGLRPLSPDPHLAATERADIDALAERLAALYTAWTHPIPMLQVSLALHVDLGRFEGSEGTSSASGPVVRVARWIPPEAVTGVYRSPAWLAGA